MKLTEGLLAPTRRLIAASFMMDFSVAMVSLAVQNLGIYSLNAPNVVLGLFATFSSVAYTVGCLFSGSISDRFGRRRCALVACVGAGLVWVLIPNVGPWKYVLCLMPLSGASISLFWPSIQAWLAELTVGGRRELTRNLGLFNIMWCAGLMIGPVATGYLWGAHHRLTFYAPAILLSVPIAIVLLTPRGKPRAANNGPADVRAHEDSNLFLKLAWIGNFASWFATGTTMAMFPKLGDTLGFTELHVGWLLFAFRAGQVAMFEYTRHEHRWQYKLWPLLVTQVAAAGGMAMATVVTQKPLFAAGFAIAGLCAGMTYVNSLFYVLHGRTEGMGKTSGFHEAVLGSGVFLGPLLGGIGAQYISLRAPFAIAACVFALACFAQLWMVARHTERQAQGSPPL